MSVGLVVGIVLGTFIFIFVSVILIGVSVMICSGIEGAINDYLDKYPLYFDKYQVRLTKHYSKDYYYAQLRTKHKIGPFNLWGGWDYVYSKREGDYFKTFEHTPDGYKEAMEYVYKLINDKSILEDIYELRNEVKRIDLNMSKDSVKDSLMPHEEMCKDVIE